METVIVRHSGPRAFLERAEPWLLQREAENNLVLGLAASLAEGASGYSSPLYFATVERAGQVAGCAFRTPPYKLGLTRMPLEAAPLLAHDVAEVYDHLPAALGPVDAVRAFGEAWAALRGVTAGPGPRQRIHSLEHVTLPSPLAPGAVRPAGPEDISLVVPWLQSFIVATGHPETDAAALARRLAGGWARQPPRPLGRRRSRIDGRMLRAHPSRRADRLRLHPPEHRRNGYASALVATLSRQILDSGFGHCVLYTDLANPTSNRIYRAIGYRPVQDVMDVEFGSSLTEGIPRPSRNVYTTCDHPCSRHMRRGA